MSATPAKPRSLLYEFAYCKDFPLTMARLVTLAAPEDWEFKRSPNPGPLPILFNYVHHTFKRIKEEYDSLDVTKKDTKICIVNDKACFNTGLYTTNYEPIFGLFGKNSIPGTQDWFLIGFFKESDFSLAPFAQLPERASYFTDISDLLFDPRLQVRVNIDHILDSPENFSRLPSDLQKQDKNYIRTVFEGALSNVRKRLAANYKIAIPQYYNGRVQLLIPMTLNPSGQANLALAIYRETNYYSGRTCLTLDMAYNNARLIVKPESDWLNP